jgi:hypothetical protein
VLAEHPDLGGRVETDGIAVGELWVHRIEEYARHCRHADLLRECIDGREGSSSTLRNDPLGDRSVQGSQNGHGDPTSRWACGSLAN